MQLPLPLPNELVHLIIDYIAYTPIFPLSTSHSLFKYTSPELLALSETNWRLRRVCLPLLFANIEIRYTRDVEKLKEHLVLLSKYTKILFLDVKSHYRVSFSETGEQILLQILPQLEQLCHVELCYCPTITNLFKAILAHPKITSVLVHQLPHESMHDSDLSKVILNEQNLFSPPSDAHFENCLKHGMRVMELQLYESEILAPEFELMTFPGLTKIEIIGFLPASFSWLSVLSSTHPTLNELQLSQLSGCKRDFTRHTPPFISSFLTESQRLNLQKSLKVREIGIRRTSTQFSQGCYVMRLTLAVASTSLLDILTLVVTSFPKLEALTLCPRNRHGPQAAHHFNYHDIATVLRQFLCLRTLSLRKIFRLLDFGNDESFLPIRPVDSSNMLDVICSRAETGLLWYASQIAKDMRSLDAILIDESGYTDDSRERWCLRGWLDVLNGNRDVGGTIQRSPRCLGREILLETRMLPLGLLAMDVSES
ncbi:hypothetical protein EV361DRAFT_341307 [Lentinula raphanica]|nr:hypothetical protein EV361DRAFT_341307 [Lentinula raphanica]